MSGSTIVFSLIVIVCITAALLLVRSNQRPSRSKLATGTKSGSTADARPQPSTRFRATSIEAGEECCKAVKVIAGKRFLVADDNIPEIPLPACDALNCSCIYTHHEDRRDEGEVRRGPQAGLRTELHRHAADSERRKKRGRRVTDYE